MKNGDTITGAIKKIWDKELIIEPDYADAFSVNVSEIASIRSDRVFTLELQDGSKLDAELVGIDEAGNQLLVVDGESRALPLAQIAELEEPEDYFDWESHIDLNASLRKGNTDSNNSRLNASSILKLGDHRHIGDLTYAREELDGVTSKQQTLLNYSYNWLFRDDWYFLSNVAYERDPIRDLDRRISVGAGFGYDIWNDAGRLWTLQLGTGYQNEQIDMEVNESAILFWAFRFSHDLLGGDLNVYHNHSITTNISGRDNTVFKTSTGTRYEITDLLYANFEFVFDYETDPADTAENEDVAVLVGLGLEFE